ncbi:hypothetical protein HO173_004316 [Letharia columbiana]|uniref:Rhodopsin domain-containing protein n=1 Tax=Letharia columbiana TaxID=112416 RepID=A0A8H6FZ42_9LECA|nr:uncharacterized protein HO173_004316 [Letharia columbiana]KAF6237426.1 hypothetical protein HO173_004316 [Letharia columbiana]
MVINTNPSTQQHTIVVVCIVAPIFSSLFAAIRIWTRIFITHSIGRDDYASLVTLPFCIAFSVLVGLGTNYGFGWHTADVPPDRFVFYYKWLFIISAVYLSTLWLYKFTILLLYLRLFDVHKPFRYVTWTVMFLVFGYLSSNLLTLIFGCTPIDKYWKSMTPGHCIPSTKADLLYGSMNFITDVLIFILPLPMIWRLKLSRENKLGVILIFMGGAIASVVALVRYAFLLRRYSATDIIWYDGKNLLWMVLEVNTGLICSCTIAFKPFFRYLASNYIFKKSSPGSVSHRRTAVPSGRRSHTGPLAPQDTGGRGFMVLGDEETEMDGFTGALGVGHEV